MSDLRTAALRALDALSCLKHGFCGITDGPSEYATEDAITALREALAKTEQTFEDWIATDEGVTRFGMQLRPEWIAAARAGWNAAKGGIV